MKQQSQQNSVGVVGLGLMGGAYTSRMLGAGLTVFGYDTDVAAMDRLVQQGGTACTSPADLASRTELILIALPSESALDAIVSGTECLCDSLGPGSVVCEMGTFPLEAKLRLSESIGRTGAITLDCPVSGTGAQAKIGDLVVYASGDEGALNIARPVLETLGREVRFVGEFGAGMKMKIVANLLVTIHNLAAAEALLLAERSGLDLQMTYDAITAGAGTSRMLEVRGPLMIAESYEPPTMKHDTYMKDLVLILKQARAVGAPAPLMAAALPLYERALSEGRGSEDTASLFSVLKGMTEDTA